VHYMPYIIGNPRHGKPKSIYQTEGISVGDACASDDDCSSTGGKCNTSGFCETSCATNADCPGSPWKCNTRGVCEDGDNFAPPHGIEIASAALGIPRQMPGIRQVAESWGIDPSEVTVPQGGLKGNLANGQATGLLGQFPPAAGSDGHFVVFDIPACREQAAQFVANLAADPIGNIPPLP